MDNIINREHYFAHKKQQNCRIRIRALSLLAHAESYHCKISRLRELGFSHVDVIYLKKGLFFQCNSDLIDRVYDDIFSGKNEVEKK